MGKDYVVDIVGRVPEYWLNMPGLGEVNLTPVLLAIGIFVVAVLAFKLLQTIVIKRLRALSEKTDTDIDDVLIKAIDGIRPWVYNLAALYLVLQLFNLPSWLDKGTTAIFLFSVIWQLIEMASLFIDYFTSRFLEKDEDNDGVTDPNSAMASHLVTLIARIGMWVFGVLFLLSNLGIEVTSLIAGLGIGGIAIAFALQGILSDLFSSFSLYFDKPFRIGDYIVIGEHSGTVEKIGIKTTRIRTLQGEELVVSNAELTSTRVQNFKKLQERRIVFKFGITFETPQEKIKQINSMVERIFDSLDGGRLDRVHFTTFADFALIFEVVYYVESANYNDYLDIQQKLNHDLMARFAEVGIEFAYPTQTIYTKQIS